MRKFLAFTLLASLVACTPTDPDPTIGPDQDSSRGAQSLSTTPAGGATGPVGPTPAVAATDDVTTPLPETVPGLVVVAGNESVDVGAHRMRVLNVAQPDDTHGREWQVHMLWTNGDSEHRRFEGLQWGTWHEGAVYATDGERLVVSGRGIMGESKFVAPKTSKRTWVELRGMTGSRPGWLAFDVPNADDVLVIIADINEIDIDALTKVMNQLLADEV